MDAAPPQYKTRPGVRLRIRAARWLVLLALVGCGPDPPRNLLIVSLDTVRRDHVSTYGYARATTPTFDRLAAQGAVFDRAFAQFTSTVASHTSMFTGLYPHTHRNEFGRELAAEQRTLAEILRDAGFRTAAFVSGFTMRGQAETVGRGFEIYDDEFEGPRRHGGQTLQRALTWLERRSSNERFFLFVHFYDAHGPYLASPEFFGRMRSSDPGRPLEWIPPYQRQHDERGQPLESLQQFVDRYDSQIRFLDELVSILAAEAGEEQTLIVILSDHGETLGDREEQLNLDHGKAVFEEQTAIPLVFHGPGIEPIRVLDLVETVDLLPTLLPMLGVEVPSELKVQGHDLFRQAASTADEHTQEPIFASCHALPAYYQPLGYSLRAGELIHSVRGPRWKLIRYPGTEEDYVELYDLEADPGELMDVADAQPAVRSRLLATLDSWLALGGEPAIAPRARAEDLESLRALGYVE